MKKIIYLISFLLLITITGCSKSTPNVNSNTLDFTKIGEFGAEKFSEYMVTLDIKSFEISQTRIANRTTNDKHFVYITEAVVTLKQGEQKENITYGFDIIINKNGDFEILHQGKEVNDTYLTQ